MAWGKLLDQAKLFRNGFSEESKCLLCGETEDRSQHFLECNHEGLKEVRKIILVNMKARTRREKVNRFLGH